MGVVKILGKPVNTKITQNSVLSTPVSITWYTTKKARSRKILFGSVSIIVARHPEELAHQHCPERSYSDVELFWAEPIDFSGLQVD